ncbi:hypothetical protein DPMN_128215 [Dreissena polymorpha]|uniref:Uncharacterized protein n=1 Tax=Dreissena polymorpha TaxID=45954 RepID=A0A9D4H3G0_DREPO|nr:hypothetical protein DPMN_128215 [Dreissena polymorpha]
MAFLIVSIRCALVLFGNYGPYLELFGERAKSRIAGRERREYSPKGEGLEGYWSVPDHFSAQRRGENILCSPSQATDNVPY